MFDKGEGTGCVSVSKKGESSSISSGSLDNGKRHNDQREGKDTQRQAVRRTRHHGSE